MNTWIFQGNPDYFDIDAYLDAGFPRIAWTVNQHAADIKPGDRVYLWRAKGAGKAKSGIIAVATVLEELWTGPDDPNGLPFWTDPEKVETDALQDKLRAWLRIDGRANAKEVVQRDWLKVDPICGGMSIIKQAAGTNFPVTDDEAARLARLWERTGVPWSRAESLAALKVYDETAGGEISKTAGSPVSGLGLLIGRAVGGAYNKVMNFRAIDPRDNRKGLSGAGDMDRAVWAEFYDEGTQSLCKADIDAEFERLWGGAWSPGDESVYRDTVEKASRQQAKKKTLAELEADLAEKVGPGKPRVGTATTTVYERDPQVVAAAKLRADYRCEVPGCVYEPFVKPDGDCYVEVHHIKMLGDGGLDVLENVACVCPGHHRELHYGEKAPELAGALMGALNMDQHGAQ